MKTRSLILSTGLLFLSFLSYSQEKTEPSNSHQYPNVVTKGYYSIGKNAEQLGRSSWEMTTAKSNAPVPKGYYSIGSNDKKLGQQLVIESDGKPSTPVATKGYYSIGSNNEKLRQ